MWCSYQRFREAKLCKIRNTFYQYLLRALCARKLKYHASIACDVFPTESSSAFHKQRHTKMRCTRQCFRRLIRLRVLALNLEMALELSAESARVRESLWYKLFVGRKLYSGHDGWPSTHIGGGGYILSFLIIPRKHTRKSREEEKTGR